jgi:uncharacterized membrane protein
MKTLAKFLKTTLVGGFLVLLPLFACGLLVIRLVETLLRFIKPLLFFLPERHLGSMLLIDLAAIVVLLLLCLLTGLILKTGGGLALGRWIESRVLTHIPGYKLFRGLTEIISGKEETSGMPVIVRRGNARQIGFLVEEHSGGESTVFFPDAPNPASGNVVIVQTKYVEKLNVSRSQIARSLAHYGLGMSALLPGRKLPASPADVLERQADSIPHA